MKYKPGTRCVVINVPDKAKVVGVEVGMPALVLEPDRYARRDELASMDDLGLVVVQIGIYSFWWNEDDLGTWQ